MVAGALQKACRCKRELDTVVSSLTLRGDARNALQIQHEIAVASGMLLTVAKTVGHGTRGRAASRPPSLDALDLGGTESARTNLLSYRCARA